MHADSAASFIARYVLGLRGGADAHCVAMVQDVPPETRYSGPPLLPIQRHELPAEVDAQIDKILALHGFCGAPVDSLSTNGEAMIMTIIDPNGFRRGCGWLIADWMDA
jgi:hypothetical protein